MLSVKKALQGLIHLNETRIKTVIETKIVRKIKGNLKIPIVFLLVFPSFACGVKAGSARDKSVGNSWHRDSIVTVTFEVEDTLQPYNMFLNRRPTNEYEFSNIFLIASLESPNPPPKVGTLEYIIASPD